jgi:hypothetical protein
MKMLAGIFILTTCYNSCFAGCFDRPVNYPVIIQPAPVVQQVRTLQPVVVQQTRLVPVVETRLEYRTIDSYYLNYRHYYYQPQFVPMYQYNYYADPWQGYNY